MGTPAPQPAPRRKNRVHIFRLLTLTIDEGTLMVRNIFEDKRPNGPLDVFMASELNTINQLKQKKTITQSQYDLLFPNIGTPVTADFDLTLIICLLRNLQCFGLNPYFAWNSTPQPGDTSLESDLCRLRNTRNEIAHMSATTGITQTVFKSKWSDIENVLLRLNASLQNPDPNLQQRIDKCKNEPLDPGALKVIEQSVQHLQTLIITEVESLKKDVDNLTIKTDEVQKKVDNLTGKTDDMKKEMDNLKTEQEKLTSTEVIPRTHDEYLRARNNLKEDLITLYRHQYHTLPLSPLIEEHDTPLLEFYVMPDVNVVESERSYGGGSEIKSKVTSLRDVFCNKTKLCRDIYLLADAGLGKTAFSRRLAMTWCQAHKRNKDDTKYFEKGETDVMSEYDFVFLLSLRDCSEECDIDQMIRKQILPFLAHKSDIIETVLSEEKSLVILDGLDEWSHPHSSCAFGQSEIPHRKARECTTIITTSRKWKFSVIKLKSSQIDQKLELVGLSKIARDKLKKSVITLLSHKTDKSIRDQIKEFSSTVVEKGVTDLEPVPLLLMYLLCLWCDEIDLGRSKCVIYCQIVELLLRRTFRTYPRLRNTCVSFTSNKSKCFDAQANCKENYAFLSSLGRLAFETLFSETRENTLVFDRSLVDKYLNPDFQE